MASFNDFIRKNFNIESEEIFNLKKDKILEILFSLCDKKLIDINKIQMFSEKIQNAKTIETLNEIEFDLIQTKKLEINRRGIISYILDYKEKHLLTDKTEKELLNKLYSIKTVEELNIIEDEIEKIIKEESSKINEEYDKIYKHLTFDDRKEEYLNKLKENIYLFERYNITYHDDKTKMMKILLNPKNELELELGNNLIVYVQDIDYMTKNDLELDYDNSLYLEVLTQLYNIYKNTDSKEKYEEIISKYDNPKAIARIAYELICLGVNGVNDFIEYFAQKNNIDLSDELEVQRLNICTEELNLKDNKKDLTEEEEMKLSIEFFKELHNEVINKDEKRK